MDKDTRDMLKKVTVYDAAILVIAAAISVINYKEYTAIIIIAIILSLANFILNAAITSYILRIKGQQALYVFSAVGRVLVTVALAILICEKSMTNFIAFLIGYSLHYIAVTIYGVTRVTKKKKGSN